MTTTYSDPQVAIECRLALGDTPDEIARRLRVPIERVWAVGERMDELAKHKDDPCDDLHIVKPKPRPRRRLGYIRNHGTVGYEHGCRCETCTGAHAERARAYRARKKAAS